MCLKSLHVVGKEVSFIIFYLPFADVGVEVEVESVLSSAENAQVMCYITRYLGVTFKKASKRLQGTVIFREGISALYEDVI